MWFSLSEQFSVILYSFIMGILFGVVYDFVKIIRVLQGLSSYSGISSKIRSITLPVIQYKFSDKQKKGSLICILLLFIGDILYSLFCAAAYSLFLFHAIRGQVRWYFIVATASGFALYYFTVSKVFIKLIEALIWGIKIVFVYLRELLYLPFRILCRISKKIANNVYCKLIKPAFLGIYYIRMTKYTKKHRISLKKEITFDKEV